MIHATETVTQNSYPLLQTGSQIRALPLSAIIFYQIIFCHSLEQGIKKINFQFVQAYFTQRNLDNKRVRYCPAQMPFQNHCNLRTPKGRFPTSACLTYCCSQHMFEVTDRRCFEHTAKHYVNSFSLRMWVRRSFQIRSLQGFHSVSTLVRLCNCIIRSSILSSIRGDSCVS